MRRAKMGHGVWMRDDTVIKIQEPLASKRERLRTLAGKAVGLQTGLFLVPEIVSFDDERGEIVFERLPMAELLSLADPVRSLELVGRAAEALAAIHTCMAATANYGELEETAPGAQHRTDVPLHGDFAIINVLHLPDSDRLVIIDWANADWIGLKGDLGAPEVDLAVFLISLFHRRAFDPVPYTLRHQLARYFLATYSAAAPHGLDLRTLRAVVADTTPGFNRLTRRLKGSLLALGHRHGMLDLRFFLRRLTRVGLDGGYGTAAGKSGPS